MIGSSPCDEPGAQVGDPGYSIKAQDECERFIALLRKKFGPEPDGARLSVKGFPHDFGEYFEVVCWYYPDTPSEEYALLLEGNAPAKWSDDAPYVAPPHKYYHVIERMIGEDCPMFCNAQNHPQLFMSEKAAEDAVTRFVEEMALAHGGESSYAEDDFRIIEATCEGCTGYSSMPIAGAPWCITRGTRPSFSSIEFDGWNCFKPRGA
jgi:hypothetical protein